MDCCLHLLLTKHSKSSVLWPGTEKPQEVASSTCGNCTGGSTNCRPTHSKSSSWCCCIRLDELYLFFCVIRCGLINIPSMRTCCWTPWIMHLLDGSEQSYRGLCCFMQVSCFLSSCYDMLWSGRSGRGNYSIWPYLSSIQHKNITSYRFVADLYQLTLSRLIWGLGKFLVSIWLKQVISGLHTISGFLLDDR